MLRNATAADIAYVVANMRLDDVRELWLATGQSAKEAVASLGEHKYVAFTLTKGDEPVAVFGATLHENGVAEMFRFATSRWPEVVREAIKIGRRVMLPLFAKAGVKRLLAHTIADSDTAWLKIFGAKQVGGRVDEKGNHFKAFAIDLAA